MATAAIDRSVSGQDAYALIPDARVSIFSLKNNRVICSDSGCQSSNALAKEVYTIVQLVNLFFSHNFGLRGLNRGNPVMVGIDWGTNNATCSCSSILGDREISCSFQFNNRYLDLKTICHEWSHGIIAHVSRLGHFGEAGALNESLADCFAMAFYKWLTGKHPDWAIADRNLAKHPRMFYGLGPYEEPSSQNDWGHVHANSTIPSHAFFAAVQNVTDKRIGAIAQVWFQAMKLSKNDETFQSFSVKTIAIAKKMDPRFAKIIQSSWQHVGVF